MSSESSAMQQPAPKLKKWLIAGLLVVGLLAVIALSMLFAAEHYTSRAQFCGTTCHIMKPNWETYKKDKHFTKKNILCVDCHYAPGEKMTLKAKFKGLGQLFSYLGLGDKEVRKRAGVMDESCSTSKCHPKQDFYEKKIDYKKAYPTEYKGVVKPFVHKTHYEKLIDGQKMHCTTCHMHSAREKHLDVPKELCYICHFRKAPENDGRSKCVVCHEIPMDKVLKVKNTEPDSSDEPRKPITHKTLEKGKVACNSCHIEMIRVTSRLKADYCVECHHDASPEMMAKAGNKKIMHEEHVAKPTARCQQCHENATHKKYSYLDAGSQDCNACHSKPHFYTKKLLAGERIAGLKEKFPSQMHEFGVNCMGCHKQVGRDEKGNLVQKGSDKACVACHNKEKKYGNMTAQWKMDLKEVLEELRASEKKTVETITEAKGKVPANVFTKAEAKLKAGQELMRTAAAGGGVHNKKLAMLLMDLAQDQFNAAVAELEGNTPKGGKE